MDTNSGYEFYHSYVLGRLFIEYLGKGFCLLIFIYYIMIRYAILIYRNSATFDEVYLTQKNV